MKKKILAAAAIAFTATSFFIACKSPAEKVEDAKENVTEANKELEQAKEEYLIDYENYKKEMDQKIEANHQSLVDFETKIEHEKKEIKENYKKKIADLEQKNKEMKEKMNNYKTSGKENWESFKAEFNHDMDELGKAFKDLTVNNVK